MSAERQASAALQTALIDEISHSVAKIFLETLDIEAEVNISNRMIKPTELVIDKMQTTQFNLISLGEHDGLIGLNSKFIETAVIGQTGAPNKSEPNSERPNTPTDIALSAVIYTAILSDIFKLPIELRGKETDKAPLHFLLLEDRYASLRVEIIDSEHISLGCFELILPLKSVEAFDAPNDNKSDEHQRWQNIMTFVAQETPLELDSVIQRIPVSLDTILNLKIGDSLDISEGSLQHLEMAAPTGKEQQILFKGQLGSLKTHKAFRVTSVVS